MIFNKYENVSGLMSTYLSIGSSVRIRTLS